MINDLLGCFFCCRRALGLRHPFMRKVRRCHTLTLPYIHTGKVTPSLRCEILGVWGEKNHEKHVIYHNKYTPENKHGTNKSPRSYVSAMCNNQL